MKHVIIGDESWIHHFDLATQQERMCWKSSQSRVKKKVHQAKLMNKVMLIFFFNARGAIYQHTYCPSPYDNQYTVLLQSFKNHEETCNQEEALSEKN